MRYLLVVILIASIGAGVSAATYKMLDKQAIDSIDKISGIVGRANNLSGEKETEFYIGLTKAAQKDRGMQDALVFGGCGTRILKAIKSSDTPLDSLLSSDSGSLWNDLQTMGRKYQGDGVLSAVNYKALAAPDGPKKLAAARAWLTDEYRAAVGDALQAYDQARQAGLTPGDAFGKMQRSNTRTPGPSAGIALMEKALQGYGKLLFTGYSAASAHSDMAAFLEANYADSHPFAPDVRAVTPVFDPTEFMGRRFEQAIHTDQRKMMRPVNDYIEHFLHPAVPTDPPPDPQPPARLTPNFDDLPLTPGSGMPTWEEMQKPPGIYPQEAGWDTQTWWTLSKCPRNEIAFKCERIAYGIDVFKMRQTSGDRNLRIISSSTYSNVVDGKGDLQPNKTYFAVFNAWYWSDKGTTAYFADGSSGKEPPSNMRSILPPGDRKVVQVKVYFKTNAIGKGCIALFVRGRCAVELDEFYHVRIADPKPATGRNKR